jgi:hypothetical protein
MRENQLEEDLKRAEEVYDGLVQTQRSLGTMLAEVIRKGGDLDKSNATCEKSPTLGGKRTSGEPSSGMNSWTCEQSGRRRITGELARRRARLPGH